MTFILELNNFQGPFDLLLDLLNERELDITEVSLAEVTDEFLSHTSKLELSIDEMNSFLFVAAKLTLNKSRAIINIERELKNEDEEDINLSEALIKYQAIKEQAKKLQSLSKAPLICRQDQSFVIKIPTYIDPTKLIAAYKNLSINGELNKKTHYIQTDKDAIEKTRKEFSKHISKLESFKAEDIINSSSNKSEAVIYFITLLDLLKQGVLILDNEYINSGAIA